MYLYFDKNGILKEIINDSAIRQYNSGINTLYMYFETSNTPIQIRLGLLLNDEYRTTISRLVDLNENISFEIPYSETRELKYFKYGKEYNFYTYTLTSEDLYYAGSLKITPYVNFLGSNITYGSICLIVSDSEVLPTELITRGEYVDLFNEIAKIRSESDYGILQIDTTQTKLANIVLTETDIETLKKPVSFIINKYYIYSNVVGYELYAKSNDLSNASSNILFAKALDTRVNKINLATGGSTYQIIESYLNVNTQTKKLTNYITQPEFLTANDTKSLVKENIGIVNVKTPLLELSNYILTENDLLELAKPYCILIHNYNDIGGYSSYIKSGETNINYTLARTDETLIGNEILGKQSITNGYITIDKTSRQITTGLDTATFYTPTKVDELIESNKLYMHSIRLVRVGTNIDACIYKLISKKSSEFTTETLIKENLKAGVVQENTIVHNSKLESVLNIHTSEGRLLGSTYIVSISENGFSLNPYGRELEVASDEVIEL